MYIINIYVVTYKNKQNIENNIKRFFHTTKHVDVSKYKLNYYVINNHSNFTVDEDLLNKVTVLHNTLRPDFSCGHLSRDYNAALIHGFKNLNNPFANQVICAHDDSLWRDGWLEDLEEIHKTYTFYAGDYGCSMTSYLPEAVKKIGIWDERMCNIGYHEADYFLRALIFNKEKSTINDYFGGRVLNPTKVVFDHPEPNIDKNNHCNESLPYHTVSRKVFEDKWNVHPENWNTRLLPNIPTNPLINTYMYYPYFELDIEDLENKKYSYAPKGLENFRSEWR